MAATIYGIPFIFGISTQEELLTIWRDGELADTDQIIVSPVDFAKVKRRDELYYVEKSSAGYLFHRAKLA
jgi:hypothetical protein